VAAGETYACGRDLSEDQARKLWLLERPGRTVVAVDTDQTVLATARVHPNHGGPGAHVATASFMVDPQHAGYRAMQFNAVVETNTRAVALWRSLGFQVLATVPEAFHHPVHGYVGLHIMHLRL
jgi:hypothetical protein